MPFATEAEQIRKFENDEVAQHYFEVLRTLISKKSIFAQQVGLKEVANYLGEIFTAAGAKVEVDDSYTAPFVIAKFFSPNPDAKTIIFYNHYDTVPADGDQPWTGDPFTLSVHYGTMYGRGVDDDKGHITARLTALPAVRARLPRQARLLLPTEQPALPTAPAPARPTRTLVRAARLPIAAPAARAALQALAAPMRLRNPMPARKPPTERTLRSRAA